MNDDPEFYVRRFVGTYEGTDGCQIAVTDSVATVAADVLEEPTHVEMGDLVVLHAVWIDDEDRFIALRIRRAPDDAALT